MFKEYLGEVTEAVISSDIFDRTYGHVCLEITGDYTDYNNLPTRKGKLLYGKTLIAEVYISAIPKPIRQFYETTTHVSAGGFDTLDVTQNKVFYMVGTWCLRDLAFQPSLVKYPGGSNFKAFYDEYLKHLEKLHKKEYDNEYEESD